MVPMENARIAEIFLQIGDMMDYQAENAFKVRSYWKAAQTLLALEESAAVVAARGELATLPGIGEIIANKIEEILATGTVPLYERLKQQVSPGIQRLLRLPGLTPRLVRILERERGVHAPEDLMAAIKQGLEELPNVNANDRAQILRAALEYHRQTGAVE
jgi:DNA polymerase (family 10)